jgi:molybdopterin/thiamine biosynthesis adenylyltransferase
VNRPDRPAARFELRLPGPLAARIEGELRDGPRDAFERERAGFVLCGAARLTDRTLLLARRWKPVPTSRRVHLPGYGLTWDARFSAEVLDEAEAMDAVPILVHRHEPGWPIRLSRRDRESGDPLLIKMSRSIPRAMAGSIVLNEREAAGLLWSNGAVVASLREVRVESMPIGRRGEASRESASGRRRLSGQTLAIGPASDAALRATTIAVIGLSGGGSHAVQQVAHQGFGTIILIDDDTVEPRSRGRLVGSRHTDDGRKKTTTMRRLVRGIDPTIRIVEVPYRTNTPQGIEALKQADIVVACVDSFRARAQINDLCRRYSIALIDVGMTLTSNCERLERATGQVVLTLPGGPCLRCTPLLSNAVLEKEERDRPAGYDENPDAPGDPQVVSFNGLLASHAAALALGLATGYLSGPPWSDGGWWQYDALEGQLDFTPLTVRRPSCPGCAEEGHGDALPSHEVRIPTT